MFNIHLLLLLWIIIYLFKNIHYYYIIILPVFLSFMPDNRKTFWKWQIFRPILNIMFTCSLNLILQSVSVLLVCKFGHAHLRPQLRCVCLAWLNITHIRRSSDMFAFMFHASAWGFLKISSHLISACFLNKLKIQGLCKCVWEIEIWGHGCVNSEWG